MDISKASNFERFVYLMLGADGAACAALWRQLAQTGQFTLAGSDAWARVQASQLVSGRSTHQNRLEVIQDLDLRYKRVIDPHTADGVFVGRQFLDVGVPMVCLETALPAKFAETIEEALGRKAPRPAALADLESLPQRVKNIDQDVEALKRLIEAHALR